ncbi:hypothetical protein [Rhizobium lentis]|uniref:hypothetical protein n=1 Tax=Rhizobium lentis TaxID=1138194 RepID=UPI001A90DAC3|nr:hypothetical protein [Rhizobium lentis]MBX5047540.1 hypothetical protein [Rhizobium lentis]MBX5060024.1 hypothetical protein [Rhizobium lentis]MBX5066716.1 hypothetical protein [Rhizobium lentis]MBX5079413.1 hypothetical protein [Rhizobium lentis]MBX5147108.1 hypothetical protein [Rhizobium lentis]
MQVATRPASLIFLSTSSAGTSGTANEADQGALKLQRATKALQQMRQTLASSADEAKAKAQRKLEQAKQELEMLKSSNMPPEVVARLAAELARKVGAAASEFASAVASGSPTTAVPADANTNSGAAAMSDADVALADTMAETGPTEPIDAAQARKAYGDAVKDGTESSGISADDREVMEQFKQIVRELKQLLERAMLELRQQDGQPRAYAAPDMGSLSSHAAGMPTSIVI